MTFDAGRIRHDGALMHYSRASNGSSIPSNWRNTATGDTGVAWAPESMRSISSNGSNSLAGDINLAAGTGIALGVASQTITITNTGSAGGGASVSYASNSNDVSYADAPGASSLVSRADHVHRGVTSVAHASNTYTGPITLETEGSAYIVRSAANTYRIGATGGAGGGGTTITTKDEGSTLSTGVTTLDFVGAGVTASGAGATTTVTIAGGGISLPTIVQFKQSGTAATTITLDSTPINGHSLLLMSDSTTGQITAVASTNTTWSQLKTFTSSGSSFYALWVGSVGASPSATITWTKPGGFATIMVMEITDTLTRTLGASASGQPNVSLSISPTSGHLVVGGGGADNTTLTEAWSFATIIGLSTGTNFTAIGVGYAAGGVVLGSLGGAAAGGAILAEVT